MEQVLSNAEVAMKEHVVNLNHHLNTIRAGRANPAILDRVVVDYYGTPTPIQQMAAVSVAENRILVITPWDKSVVGEVEKALLKSNIGITPNNDGTNIRIAFPQPTEERRKELTREVRAHGEEAKVQVRNTRREANEALKKFEDTTGVSEDDIHRMEQEVQELTDKYIKEIDQVVENKEKEVMAI